MTNDVKLRAENDALKDKNVELEKLLAFQQCLRGSRSKETVQFPDLFDLLDLDEVESANQPALPEGAEKVKILTSSWIWASPKTTTHRQRRDMNSVFRGLTSRVGPWHRTCFISAPPSTITLYIYSNHSTVYPISHQSYIAAELASKVVARDRGPCKWQAVLSYAFRR
jgi:hypothetical protein